MGLLALAQTNAALAAGTLETLVMPGPVIAGHAELETECGKCHARFKSGDQNPLCLDCHDAVADDLRTGRGYHGRAPSVKAQACKGCHTEHRGRDADIVRLDRDTFDHRLSDFPLEGAHAGTACQGCHAPDKKLRDAPGACVDCHRRDDPHQGRLGEQCQDCHTVQGWARTEFDHASTDFPLRGAHRKVDCQGCHANERYRDTPTACVACHRLDDVHGGRYGAKCADCHSEQRWAVARFDHDRTDFPLQGGHREVACDACHRGDLHQPLPTDCKGCHEYDDAHKGRFGEECDRCHQARSWTQLTFDHDRDTDFALRARHAEAACLDCHRQPLYTGRTPADCHACHRGDDVHAGQQGERCEQCHQVEGWNRRVAFDHGLTPFPLIGLHAVVGCAECHAGLTFKDAERACTACHADDDAHEGRLGEACQQCHTPNGWRIWLFDHDLQTDFALDGAHAELACEQCHRRPVQTIAMRKDCASCHGADDVHRGQLGPRCEQCHVTETFRRIKRQ